MYFFRVAPNILTGVYVCTMLKHFSISLFTKNNSSFIYNYSNTKGNNKVIKIIMTHLGVNKEITIIAKNVAKNNI